MSFEAVPVELFVNQCFQNSRVIKTIAEWRVEPAKLEALAVGYVRELGIHFVSKYQRKVLLETIIYCLKRSNDVRLLVRRAETDESERRRSRHAEL